MAPLGTQDFGSYLTKVGSPDVVFGGFAGADAVGFVKQYRKFAKLLRRWKIYLKCFCNAVCGLE